MINYVNFDKFNNDSIDKQLTLTFSGGDVFTNTNLEQESFELTESLCSGDQLEFGSCEASMLKFTVWGVFTSHAGQTVTVTIVLDRDTANPFVIGTYKVIEDVASADRTKRTMTCYDALYEVLNADVATWYNSLYSSASTTKTIRQIRDSFFSNFGITQESVTLINDSVTVGKTISPSILSGRDVLAAICQVNGVFGHITRDNKFRYVSISEITDEQLFPEETLYPATDLYPQDNAGTTPVGENGNYISLDYSDYLVEKITKVVIRQDTNDIGGIAGSGENAFVVQGNFLMFGKNSAALNSAATALLEKVQNLWYRPCRVEVRGNLCFEVGDGIRIVSKYETVLSYVLSRTYKGVQAPRDILVSRGLQLRNSQVNSVNSELIQLQGKTVQIKKDVDEVSVTMTEQLDDTVYGSYAYQTSQKIGTVVNKTGINNLGQNETLYSEIQQTPHSISMQVSGTAGKTSGAGITITLRDAYGNLVDSADGTVYINGNVIFTSNLTDGVTQISGSNITTGTIDADEVNVINVDAKSITVGSKFSATVGGAVSIGGFEVDSTRIMTDEDRVTSASPGLMLRSGVNGTTKALAIGYTSYSSYGDAKFYVNGNGEMHATGAVISGEITATSGEIAGFTIKSHELTTTTASDPYHGFTLNDVGEITIAGSTVTSIDSDGISTAGLTITSAGTDSSRGFTYCDTNNKQYKVYWKSARDAVSDNDFVLCSDD